MSLASVGLRPNFSSPNLHCTLIGRHTTARRRLRRCTPHPLPMPALATFLSLLPWHGPNLSFVIFHKPLLDNIHRAMCMHSADYAVARCLSVCLSHCVETTSNSFHCSHTILVFLPNLTAIFRRGHPQLGRQMQVAYKNRDFRPISRFYSKKRYKTGTCSTFQWGRVLFSPVGQDRKTGPVAMER